MRLTEITDTQLEEKVLSDMTKDLLPKPILHWLKRASHKDAYKKIIKLHKIIMKDQNLSVDQALIKAAGVYGISPREILAVMNKERRHT